MAKAPRKKQKLSEQRTTEPPPRDWNGRFSSVQKFPKFMELPLEIRNMIYKLAFSEADNVKVHYKRVRTTCKDKTMMRPGEHLGLNAQFTFFNTEAEKTEIDNQGDNCELTQIPHRVLGLFSVSKLVAEEAISVFYLQHNFVFVRDDHLFKWLRGLSVKRKQWLSKIELSTWPDYHRVPNIPGLFSQLESCPRLGVLNMQLLDRLNPKDLPNISSWRMDQVLSLAGRWDAPRRWKKVAIVLRGHGHEQRAAYGVTSSGRVDGGPEEVVLSRDRDEGHARKIIHGLRAMWMMYSKCLGSHDLSLLD